MFSRRNFVTGLLALPGVALAKFAPKIQQREGIGIPGLGSWNGMIDRIMEQTKGGVKIQFGNWLVMWTGWKEQIPTIDIVGQWAAFPVDNEQSCLSRRVVFVSTPGYYGVLNLGDCINTMYHWPQPTPELYLRAKSREAALASLEPYRRISLESLLQLLHNIGSKNGIGQTADDQVFNAWNSLSARCQFWLDAPRYLTANYSPAEWRTTTLALDLHRKFLGTEEFLPGMVYVGPDNILIKT